MARSFRHTPIIGMTTCRSEKKDKTFANRKLRHINKNLLQTCEDWDELSLSELREVSNVWCFGKDGKQRMTNPLASYYAKCMRK